MKCKVKVIKMTLGNLVILAPIAIAHIVLATQGTKLLLKSRILNPTRIRYNIVLLWTIPILWYILIKVIHQKNPGSHEVPIKNDRSSNNFYESGLGGPGTGIGNR